MSAEERKMRLAENIFLAVRIGDALGMPVETMSPEEIIKALGPNGVTGYLDPVQKRIHKTAQFKAGNYTDDWQLTKGNIQSFIENGDYDPMGFAKGHVTELVRSVAGWGGTTRKGLEEIKKYFETSGREGRHPIAPAVCGPGKGGGNGVAMQISPFAVFYNIQQCGCRREPLMSSVLSLGRMTHSELGALATAYLLATGISYLITSPVTEDKNSKIAFVQLLYGEMEAVEQRFVRSTEIRYKLTTMMADLVTDRHLEKSLPLYTYRTGCLATESVLYSFAKFLQHPSDLEAAVLEAVNDGGDTDSTAGMVGALCAANGAEIPGWMINWPNQLSQDDDDNPDSIRTLTRTFCDAALGR